jgi:hypothetical protein
VAVGLDGDFLAEDEVSGGVLDLLAVGLSLLRTVNTAEADALRVSVVQDFDDVAVGEETAGPEKSAAARAGIYRAKRKLAWSHRTKRASMNHSEMIFCKDMREVKNLK